MLFEPLRHGQRVRALRLHADAQRLQALEHDPRIERRQRHAGGAHDRARTRLTISFDGPQIAPAITRPWPSRYLVPE
jgi:hypothetical protein